MMPASVSGLGGFWETQARLSLQVTKKEEGPSDQSQILAMVSRYQLLHFLCYCVCNFVPDGDTVGLTAEVHSGHITITQCILSCLFWQ